MEARCYSENRTDSLLKRQILYRLS